MSKKRGIIVGSIVLILLVGFLTIPKLRSPKDISQKYDFVTVSKMDLSEKVSAVGTVIALDKKDLFADFSGTIESIKVKAGDRVKKGDVLITITSTALKDQGQEADFSLKEAEISLRQANTELATEVLLNSISRDNAVRLESAYHKVEVAKEKVKQAKERIEALKLKNDSYYAGEEKLVIRAPFTGQIAWVNVSVGDKISTQTLLTTVIKPDSLGVEAQIDENDISLIKTSQKAVVIGNDPDQSENTGSVTEVGIIGQTSGQIVNFPVKIKLTDISKGLLPGMSVDVNVVVDDHPQALTVPAESVTSRNGKNYVSIRKGNQVEQRMVQLGIKNGKYWEVTSGLKSGDQVAIPKPGLLAERTGFGHQPRMGSFRR